MKKILYLIIAVAAAVLMAAAPAGLPRELGDLGYDVEALVRLSIEKELDMKISNDATGKLMDPRRFTFFHVAGNDTVYGLLWESLPSSTPSWNYAFWNNVDTIRFDFEEFGLRNEFEYFDLDQYKLCHDILNKKAKRSDGNNIRLIIAARFVLKNYKLESCRIDTLTVKINDYNE